MIKWKEEYSIGIELIDNQHKHLFEIGNSAYELLEKDSGVYVEEKLVQVIEDLIQYTRYHFKCEEEYMIKISYPKYSEQKKEHDEFINKINSVEVNVEDINQKKYIEELLALIFNWILHHVLHEDKGIARYSLK